MAPLWSMRGNPSIWWAPSLGVEGGAETQNRTNTESHITPGKLCKFWIFVKGLLGRLGSSVSPLMSI
jgi:predicted thioredoxin/glutaredoxin